MAKIDHHDDQPALALLTPRHIDNLTDALRNQNRLLALQAETDKRQLAITEALNVNVRELNKSVTRLAKILSNGHGTAAVDEITETGIQKQPTRRKG